MAFIQGSYKIITAASPEELEALVNQESDSSLAGGVFVFGDRMGQAIVQYAKRPPAERSPKVPSQRDQREERRVKRADRQRVMIEATRAAIEQSRNGQEYATVAALALKLGISQRTVRDRVAMAGFRVRNGKIFEETVLKVDINEENGLRVTIKEVPKKTPEPIAPVNDEHKPLSQVIRETAAKRQLSEEDAKLLEDAQIDAAINYEPEGE